MLNKCLLLKIKCFNKEFVFTLLYAPLNKVCSETLVLGRVFTPSTFFDTAFNNNNNKNKKSPSFKYYQA